MTPSRRPYVSRTAKFATGPDTPRAVLEECLADVERWELSVGAFTAFDVEGARRAADAATHRWRAGKPLSAIDGMPVGVKDMIETSTMPTGMGSSLYDNYRPHIDAASVQGLHESGAVILGKTVTTEFASTQPRGTRNPHDLARTPGGSSSGSAAAVATGMVCGALGTQVVGSIIRPAGFCGVYGFKPTAGGINRGGSLDFLSQSCTGTLAATLADVWEMARAISERVGGDPGHPGLTGPLTLPPAIAPKRLGLLRTAGWPQLEPTARAALEAALEHLRKAGVEIIQPEQSPALAALETATATALPEVYGINAWEWRWPLGSYMARDKPATSPSAQERHARAIAMTQSAYAAHLQNRAAARALLPALAAEMDGLISVTAPGAAPTGLESTGNPIFVVPGTYLGVPVTTIPALKAENLPLGLQLLGFPWADATLFSHTAWIEATIMP